jgi:hypothetical protein
VADWEDDREIVGFVSARGMGVADAEDLADYWQRRALVAEQELKEIRLEQRRDLRRQIQHNDAMFGQMLGALLGGGEAAIEGAAAYGPPRETEDNPSLT